MSVLSLESKMAALVRVSGLSSLYRSSSGVLRSSLLRPKQISPVSVLPVRWLNLHEYQSKKIMQDNGLHVQRFVVCDKDGDSVKLSKELNADEYVIKAQILAGGRGKGTFDSGLKGGVHLTRDPEKVGELTKQMFGYKLATKQTSKEGVPVRKVMVAEAYDIDKETYLAILMDRDHNGPVIVGSPQGGMDIEEVAKETPEFIYKVPVDIMKGLQDKDAKWMAGKLGFTGQLQEQAMSQIKKLYKLFLKVDATQIEINPFGLTPDGKVVCFDAKFNFDDNAKFRHEDIFAIGDNTETDPREVQASEHDLNYIGMDGNIACLVNGAGLAMATMDIIKLHGGEPSNFLDLGGGVQIEGVLHGFKICSQDPSVKVILVNIFGGIVDCSIVADGIVTAYESLKLDVPIVVRLEGNNVDKAQHILEESGLPLIAAKDMDDAAMKAVVSLGD